MGENEINVLKEVIRCLAENNFEHAKLGIESLRTYNTRLIEIKRDIDILNKLLKSAEHYTLRAREGRDPKTIAFLKEKAFGESKEALIIVERLKTIANSF
jgi:hypothetical protein